MRSGDRCRSYRNGAVLMAGNGFPEAQEPDARREGSGRRRVLLVLAIAFIIACVVAGGLLLLRPDDSPGDDRVPAGAGPVASASSSPAPDPADTAGLTSAPRDVSWARFRGLALPSSKTAGPFVIDGPLVRNYEHTPTGALIAATQISARYLITPDGGWRQVLDKQVMPGPGRDTYTRLRAQLTDAAPTSGFAQFAGFRFITYTPDVAVISLANRAATGATTVTTTTVHWSGGDWRVEIAPSGLAQPQAVTDLAGYVPWSGTP
jgi:hypothetical protein